MHNIYSSTKLKTNVFILLLAVLFFACSLRAESLNNEKPTINILTFQAPPWIIKSDDNISGLAFNKLKAIESLTPFQFSLNLLPAKRAFNQAALNKGDFPTTFTSVVYPCSATKKREEKFIFTKQIKGGESNIFTLDKTLFESKKNIDALAHTPKIYVGTLLGHVLEEELKEAKVKFIAIKSMEQLIKMMIMGRINAIYGYKDYFMNEIANNSALKNLLRSSPTIYEYPIKNLSYGFCFNKNSPNAHQYIEQINNAIDALKM